MRLIVARVGRAHGIRGEVTVEVRTDIPERRFVEGTRLFVDPDGPRPPGAPKTLLLTGVRDHNGVLLLSFEGVGDRGAADALRGVRLEAEVTDEDEEPDAWFDHQLIGLEAVDPSGRSLGEVVAVEHPGAQDRLVVRRPDGARRMVPFVAAIVPTVDVGAGRVVIDAPGGLIDDVDDAEGRTTT
ncbi:MAG: rRNA processing protein RimM [Actinomycetota bacterium]|nr:rRNA processing protein RimM [Actinomycetota bacterium]